MSMRRIAAWSVLGFLVLVGALWGQGIITTTFFTIANINTIPNPGNPPSGQVRLYADSTTGNLTCLTSTGASCVGSGSGGSSGSPSNGTFNISNVSCGGVSNCLQWTDDDSTDNCGSGTTSFVASVNAYAGKGIPQVFIWGSSTGKAYKLATCNLIFTNSQGVFIHGPATIDCAMALQSCIQFGATATSGGAGSNASLLQSYRAESLTLIGGTSLTGSGGNGSGVGAGIYVMPHTSGTVIDNVSIGGSGTQQGFGVNGTYGTCSTYGIYFDYPLPDGVVSNSVMAVNSNGVASGACGFGNPNGVTTGSNTIIFTNNIVFTDGEASGSGQCGSIGITDGGSLGYMAGNNIFGFGIPILVQGVGHKIGPGNQLDSTQCAAGGVQATIQVGSATTVGPLSITGNTVQLDHTGAAHAKTLIALQNGSTASLVGWTITSNLNNTDGSATIMPAALTCTPPTGAASQCVQRDNQEMIVNIPCSSAGQGWQGGNILAQCFPAAQTGNLSSQTLLSSSANYSSNQYVLASCQVVLTVAGTSSTLPVCNITYQDNNTNTSQTLQVTPAWAANTAGCTGTTSNTVGNSCQGTVRILPKALNAITFTTSGYASTGTAMQYIVYPEVSKLL